MGEGDREGEGKKGRDRPREQREGEDKRYKNKVRSKKGWMER